MLIGKGTQLSKYLINHDKTYEVVLKLGTKTDTADSEGKILKEQEVDVKSLKEANVQNVINSFIGKQEQMPPMYSAIKVKGKKLYEYARKGESIEVQPRQIEIYNLEVNKIDKENLEIWFKVSCSKGTYIRSLCEDIAAKLNTVGYMKELRRTKVGDFVIENAVTLKELEQSYKKQEFMDKYFISIETMFKENSKIELDTKTLTKFLNGVKLQYNFVDGIYKIYNNETFIGIGVIKDKKLKRDIIIKD